MENTDRYQWRKIAGRYRICLYEDGRAGGESATAKALQGGKINRSKGFSDAEIEKEIERCGELSLPELLSSKVSYFLDGAVIGSRGFVDGVIDQLNAKSYWPKPRKTKSSHWSAPKKNLAAAKLWSLRNIQHE